MPNYNPKTEQLALGRGKRQKLDHETISMRVSPTTRQSLESIAINYNCLYGGKPQISGLLERIAMGDLLIVPAPPTNIVVPHNSDETLKESAKQRTSLKYGSTLNFEADTTT